MDSSGPAGFILPSLLSPPPSSTASSTAGGPLPTPRHTPLKGGSAKQTVFINAVDHRILQIQRRFAKKEGQAEGAEKAALKHVDGYTSFKQAAKDIDKVIDLVWVSGTPSVQIPYLLSLAGLVVTFIPAFTPAPRSMFSVLGKLDYTFASLVQGKDLNSGETLSGMHSSGGVSGTEKVRIKSLVERTRVVVVEAMNADEFEPEDEDEEEDDELDGEITSNNDDMEMDLDMAVNDFDMDVARVYDKTLVELGDTLSGPEIGIPSGG